MHFCQTNQQKIAKMNYRPNNGTENVPPHSLDNSIRPYATYKNVFVNLDALAVL